MSFRSNLSTLLMLIPLAIALTTIISLLPRSWIEIPLLGLIGFLQSILSTLPQVGIWALLVAVLLLTAIASIPRESVPAQKDDSTSTRYESSLVKWKRLIDERSEGPYFEWRLSNSLRELALEVLSFTERQPVDELRTNLVKIDRLLPEVQQQFLQQGLEERSLDLSREKGKLSLEFDLNEFIESLENKLEGRSEC